MDRYMENHAAEGIDDSFCQKWREGIHYCYDLARDVYDYVTGACDKIAGCSSSQLMNEGIEWLLKRMHPEDVEWICDEVESHLDEDSCAEYLAYRLCREDGQFVRVFELRKVTANTENCPSKMVGIICMFD